jgi:thiamine-phosphate pyrophosphorylase
LGRAKVLGISCYDDIERARAAHAAGADYLAFGSFYASPTKPLARRAGFELFGLARREFGLPIAAIGGIQLHNAAELLAAGADLLAVITDLYGAAQPYTQACAYAALFAAETNLETHEETP